MGYKDEVKEDVLDTDQTNQIDQTQTDRNPIADIELPEEGPTNEELVELLDNFADVLKRRMS